MNDAKRPVPVRARCPECGDVHLPLTAVTVRFCVDTRRWSCCFRCPDCGGRVAQESDGHILHKISGLGAATEVWELPAELGEPRPIGAPFTWDDVLDFHLLLRDVEPADVCDAPH